MEMEVSWFFGERQLEASDVQYVFKFYRYHLMLVDVALLSLIFPRNMDRVDDMIALHTKDIKDIKYTMNGLKTLLQ